MPFLQTAATAPTPPGRSGWWLKGHTGGYLLPGSGTHEVVHGLYQPDPVQHAGHQAQLAQVVDLQVGLGARPKILRILRHGGRGAECRLEQRRL
jgi:hypothetical protein